MGKIQTYNNGHKHQAYPEDTVRPLELAAESVATSALHDALFYGPEGGEGESCITADGSDDMLVVALDRTSHADDRCDLVTISIRREKL